MTDLWELICHHTYRGVPGCIVDLSPSGASHGRAVGLLDSDFLLDGAAPGSGAINFENAQGSVRVRTTAEAWRRLDGVKGEVTLKAGRGFQYIVDSDGFELRFAFDEPSVASRLLASFKLASGQYDTITARYEPPGRWTTLGFMHDGFGTMELSADGRTLARSNAAYPTKLRPGSSGIVIGNRRQADERLHGRIDEVKIWRLNPRRFDDGFNSRPTDDPTADCWARLRRELAEALRRHPECARQIGAAMDDVLRGILQATAQAPDSRAVLARIVRDYGALWRAGKAGGPEMARVFADLIGWFKSVGIPIAAVPALAGLAESECLRVILGEIASANCDPQAVQLLKAIADTLR